ncbi:MAG: penicillin-binding protein 2, partial [Bdellovibrionaceae bacterium]|nr:penicillin-binding protein 2 [Pseudobdellovibrionaceae bacterium]
SHYVTNWEDTFEKLAQALMVPRHQIENKIKKAQKKHGRYSAIKLKDNLTLEEVFRLKRLNQFIPGIDIREKALRSYELKDNGSQLFGYVGEISKAEIPLYKTLYPQHKYEQGNTVGKFGIEELLEGYLRGQSGLRLTQVDAFGREITFNLRESVEATQILGSTPQNIPPVPGLNVQLTIDLDIQESMWNAFKSMNRVGAAVMLNRYGEVLGWVSVPGFDPNSFVGGIAPEQWSTLVNDPFKPLRNKVIQDHFAPGSTFKPIVALVALQEKVVSANTLIHCPGSIFFGNRQFHDHKKWGFGNINIFDAIERSSNVYFYKMGIALGVDRIHHYATMLGIGHRSGIELPRESPGLMPSSGWKKKTRNEEWHPGENLSVAIGQGFVQVTPLQMAVAYLAIATSGEVYRPFLVKKIFSKQKTILEKQPELIRKITEISPEHFATVKEALRRVVNGAHGTARGKVRLEGVEISGKTGTAQVRGFSAHEIFAKCELRPIHLRHHGWFIGYAPSKDPEIVLVVLSEHSCSGSGGAGPIAQKIFYDYFKKYHPNLSVQIPKPVAQNSSSGSQQSEPPEQNPEVVEE